MANQNAKDAFAQGQQQASAASICVADIVKVVSFDAAAMKVNVQPLTRYPDEDTFQDKPQVLGVPVAMVYGGGYIIRPVYQEGDVGVVMYLDRDSDSTISGGEAADPNTERLHSGDDAVFVGGILSGKNKIDGHRDGALDLGTTDGGVYVSISKEDVKIKVGDSVSITASKSNIQIKGDVKIDGNLGVTKTGTADVDFVAAGKSLKTHTHTSAAHGSPTTPPV